MKLSYRTIALLVMFLIFAVGVPVSYSSTYPLFASPEIPSKSREWGYIIITVYFSYLLIKSVYRDYSVDEDERG